MEDNEDKFNKPEIPHSRELQENRRIFAILNLNIHLKLEMPYIYALNKFVRFICILNLL